MTDSGPANTTQSLAAAMPVSYAGSFTASEQRAHEELVSAVTLSHPCAVRAQREEGETWSVTVAGVDCAGALSAICGLFVALGLEIREARIFSSLSSASAAPSPPPPRRRHRNSARRASRLTPTRRLLDAFLVAESRPLTAEDWTQFEAQLAECLGLLISGDRDTARRHIVRGVAGAMQAPPSAAADSPLEMSIEIDNDADPDRTRLEIRAPDSFGFLYELTNALSMGGVQIDELHAPRADDMVHDVLYITDARHRKVEDETRLRQLVATTRLIKRFTHLLPAAANPESALLHFGEFVATLTSREDAAPKLNDLDDTVLETLARLFGVSDFLWDDFLRQRHDEFFPFIAQPELLKPVKSRADLVAEWQARRTAATGADERITALNRFKDAEMFRIDLRHLFGHCPDIDQFGKELTALAEALVQAAVELSLEALQNRYGTPRLDDGRPCALGIHALGKFGGGELGYASDLELLFTYSGAGRTDGEQPITNAEFYERLVQEFTKVIHVRGERLFAIDLRLRPYGMAGPAAVSTGAFYAYYQTEGGARPFERQALVRLRPVWGDDEHCAEIRKLRDRFVYSGQPYDVSDMLNLRRRQMAELVKPGVINAKLSRGGLVDLEYTVQLLQIKHGADNPDLRQPGALEAIAALRSAGIIDAQTAAGLRDADIFLRRLIDAMRMVRGHARDLRLPPPDSREHYYLARRLGLPPGDEAARLSADLKRHMDLVLRLRDRLLAELRETW